MNDIISVINSKKLSIANRKIKCRIATIDRGDSAVDILKFAMTQLKEQGYKGCQFTTLFDTKNEANKYRAGTWVNLNSLRPIFNMWLNNPTADSVFCCEDTYQKHVNAPII